MLTLVIGVGLGWAVRSERIQRNATAAITKAGGKAYYDWQMDGGYYDWNKKPWWPGWLDNLLGADYFGHVAEVLLHDGASDAVLGHVGNLSRLERLWLCNEGPEYGHPALTDTGLANLEKLTHLRELTLRGTSIIDANLTHIRKLTRLTRLDLSNTRITDSGLAHIKDLPRIQHLDLGNTAVTDAGLAHLKGMAALDLDLRSTAVTAAGIADLMRATKLRALWPAETQVTDSEMRELRKSFPRTQIEP